jgi:hypothetical protein
LVDQHFKRLQSRFVEVVLRPDADHAQAAAQRPERQEPPSG